MARSHRAARVLHARRAARRSACCRRRPARASPTASTRACVRRATRDRWCPRSRRSRPTTAPARSCGSARRSSRRVPSTAPRRCEQRLERDDHRVSSTAAASSGRGSPRSRRMRERIEARAGRRRRAAREHQDRPRRAGRRRVRRADAPAPPRTRRSPRLRARATRAALVALEASGRPRRGGRASARARATTSCARSRAAAHRARPAGRGARHRARGAARRGPPPGLRRVPTTRWWRPCARTTSATATPSARRTIGRSPPPWERRERGSSTDHASCCVPRTAASGSSSIRCQGWASTRVVARLLWGEGSGVVTREAARRDTWNPPRPPEHIRSRSARPRRRR